MRLRSVDGDRVKVTTAHLALAGALPLLIGGVGCSVDSPPDEQVVRIEVWAHDGTDAERRVLEEQVAAFDALRDDIEVSLRVIPEGDYADAVQVAVAGGDLPDVVEVDGPLLAGYVYQRALVPLEDLLPASVLSNQLPSLRAQGVLDGRTYAVGAFDSGLGLYADRRALRAAGITWPTDVDAAWSVDAFSEVLERLAAHDEDGKVLDVKLNYGVGEWLTYGFSPLVASAGGRLIDPESLTSRGHLDGPAAVRALEVLRGWVPRLDPNDSDDAFTARRAPLSWVGHWVYPEYAEALGEDLLVLPLPDLGNGSKTGQGSWAWGVTTKAGADRAAAAGALLTHLLRDEEVLRMTAANGAVPGSASALEASPLYREGGPLRLFAEQLLRSCGDGVPTPECVAVPRPVTPGYAVLTSQFAQAVSLALAGRDGADALRDASEFVDRDLAANDHFP